jgi:SprT protein
MQLSLFRRDPPEEKPVKAPKTDPHSILRKHLVPHLDEAVLDSIIDWLIDKKVQLRISKSRSTKLGDYRYPKPGSPPRISVNHNLNRYSFLITLVHEMAHHDVYLTMQEKGFNFLRKKKPIKPHGQEWKAAYRQRMAPYLNAWIFPEEVLSVLQDYFENPRASSSADHHLARMLKTFDHPNGKVILETLPLDAVFHLPNNKKFQKKEKVRTRYRCICLKTKRIYLFNPLAEVYST